MQAFLEKLRSSQLFKILALMTLFLLLIYLVVLIFFQFYPYSNHSIQEKSYIASAIKNIFQILFFITIGALTILSYLQAKHTLFNPIRTEIFKMQIKDFEAILNFFQNKGESILTDEFDFDQIVRMNATQLIDDYLIHFFKDKINLEKFTEHQEENMKASAGIMVSKEHLNEGALEFIDLVGDIAKTPVPKKEITNPAIILNNWMAYKYNMINFTKKYSETADIISKFQASPLIPKELKSIIERFDEAILENIYSIGSFLTELAKDLPTKCPTIDSVNDLSPHGVWNMYNEKKIPLEPIAKEILEYINQYLKIEKLIK